MYLQFNVVASHHFHAKINKTEETDCSVTVAKRQSQEISAVPNSNVTSAMNSMGGLTQAFFCLRIPISNMGITVIAAEGHLL